MAQKVKIIKLRFEAWKAAKMAAIEKDQMLMDWVEDAIYRKLDREKGGKR